MSNDIDIDDTDVKISEWVIDALELWMRPRKLIWRRKFAPAPDAGYGMTPGKYQEMCDDLEYALSVCSKRKVTLSPAWRDSNKGKTVGEFIGQLTTVVRNAPAANLVAFAREILGNTSTV